MKATATKKTKMMMKVMMKVVLKMVKLMVMIEAEVCSTGLLREKRRVTHPLQSEIYLSMHVSMCVRIYIVYVCIHVYICVSVWVH